MRVEMILKHVCACVVILVFGGTSMAYAENLVVGRKWTYFADTVMGGISTGGGGFDQSVSALHLQGNVSTANNGGFIQIRTELNEGVGSNITGVNLKVKGNGETYFVHLRNRASILPWQYYSAEFTANRNWETINIPFSAFKRSSSFMPKSYNPSGTKTVGLVAFGKDYKADLWVSDVSFY